MQTTWTILGAALLAAACTTQAASPRAYDRPTHLQQERRDAAIRRLTAERVDHARELARECLAGSLPSLPESEQRAALARCRGLSSSVLADLPPAELAALVPMVLRVYDLGVVLDGGPDDDAVPLSLEAATSDDAVDGSDALLLRIAQQLRETDPALWQGDAFVDAVGEHLIVLQRPDAFDAVEHDLDRLATVGGGFARIRVAVMGATDVPADATHWESADYEARWTAARKAGRSPRELTLDVPFGRSRGAFDGVQTSYVQDFDVDAGSGLADPVIGTLRTGVAVSATYGAPDRGGSAQLEIRVSRSVAVEPLPEFTTQIEPGASPVTIQIPELQLIALGDQVSPTAAGAARSALARNIEIDDGNAHTAVPGTVFVVHTQAFGQALHARPGWTRVSPSAVSQSLDAPLLQQAAPLAALHLEQGDERNAEAELRFALTQAEGHAWRERLRISPDVAEGVLVRWPATAADDTTERALHDANVEAVDGCGFVTVKDGLVIAYVTPESVGCVARALGALRRRATHAVLPVAFDDAHDDPLRCADTSQISFVQDFDVEIAAHAAIADPIIGVIQEGAVAEAVPVPTEGRGTFDVRLTHLRSDAPIREFTTSLSLGAPVTLQLPRQRISTTWRRAVLQPGKSVRLESRIGSGGNEDVRHFVLRAAD